MSNEAKTQALNMNFGTASHRLRKSILFDLLRRFDLDHCFRCEQKIEDVDDLSIEHKEPWQGANDPKAAFFDLKNIAFSHLRCNVGAANRDKERCPAGHAYTKKNTYLYTGTGRQCRACDRKRMRRRYRMTDWREKRKQFPSRNTPHSSVD